MLNAEKRGVKLDKWGRCQLAAIAKLSCKASFVFPSFTLFKVVYHEYLFSSIGGTHIPFLRLK